MHKQHNYEPELTPPFDNSIDAAKTRTLYENLPLAMAGSIALILILSVSHWNVIGHGALIAWCTIISSVITLRLAVWYFWKQNFRMLATGTWLTLFRCGAWLTGAAWGSTAFLMFADYNPIYQALLAYTIAGVSSGAFSSLAFDKDSAIGFVCLAVFPLSIRLFMEHGPIAVPMGMMSIVYLSFVIGAATRARKTMEEQYQQNLRLLTWNQERIEQQKLNNAISHAKSQFIKDNNFNHVLLTLLEETLELSGSNFGFIGEIFHNQKKNTELHIHALSNFSNDDQLSNFYQASNNLKPILAPTNVPFGAAILNGKPIISNNPNKDIRAGGLPSGHPPLVSFLAIPIFVGATQVAVLCIANKTSDYDEKIIDFIKPVIATLAQFFEAIMHNRQQKNYEEKLHSNVNHTQAILDEVFDAIITIDQYGKIKSFNHAAEMIFGYRAHEIIDSSINQLIPLTARTDIEKSSDNKLAEIHAFMSGQQQNGLRRNGKQFPINLATSTISIEGEQRIIGVIRDMSETKRAEELKNEFISTISHELRTPLTSIAGALGILNHDSATVTKEQQQQLLDIAIQNSARLQTLIANLLDMDQLIANKMDMDLIPHRFTDLINKAIINNAPYANSRHITVEFNFPAGKIFVCADGHRIQQVLAHLLSNATKFSHPNSKINIQITPAGKFSRVAITDSGCGIPENKKENIFKPFSHTNDTEPAQKIGGGLSLAISKELIQKMGGNIGFTSTENSGSSFYVELPLVENHIANTD